MSRLRLDFVIVVLVALTRVSILIIFYFGVYFHVCVVECFRNNNNDNFIFVFEILLCLGVNYCLFTCCALIYCLRVWGQFDGWICSIFEIKFYTLTYFYTLFLPHFRNSSDSNSNRIVFNNVIIFNNSVSRSKRIRYFSWYQ